MRIGGLASGMDIDTIVSDLMKAERMPLDKLTKNKQVIEWQRDAYREMNTLLLNFRNQTFDMKLSSNFGARTVTSSNESKVTAIAKSAADLSSFTISQIDKLATAATKVNAGAISKTGEKIDAAASLDSMKDKFVNNNFGWTTGSVESETISVEEVGQPLKLELKDGVKLQNIASHTSVKVDGKSYTVVEPSDPAVPLEEGQVLVDADGNLQFYDDIAKGSIIKIDFAADKRIETATITKEMQLAKKSPIDGIVLTIGAETYTSSGNQFLNDDGSVFATIDDNGKITLNNELDAATEVTVEYRQNYFAFDIGSHTSKGQVSERFLIQGSDSLNSVLSKISSSEAGISAYYDSFKDQVTLTRKETGNFNESGDEIITTSTNSGFLNDVLRFGAVAESGGDNAEFTVNGLSTQRTSNTFDMNGVTFTLKDKLLSTEPSISINVANDTDKVVENITKYVNSYNELIEKIQTKVNEEKYKDYLPLTDTEREELSEKQQEKWEEMARSGLLRRDSLLSGLLSKMRTDFYSPVSNATVDSSFKQLSSIGITTTSNYLEGGKLVINEDELRKAIEENPESIEKLFTSSGSTSGEQGILNRLYDSITNTMDSIKTKAGNSNATNDTFTLGKNLNRITDQMNRFEDRLTQVENRYWAQFTAMEKAIQQSNSQMSYLMQQFSS
jgi:flagellar hook-associated protein 2